MPNAALERMMQRDPMQPLPEMDDLDSDALLPAPDEPAFVQTKDDAASTSLANTGGLQGPLQGDESKGGAMSAPGARGTPPPAKKKKPVASPSPAKKPSTPARASEVKEAYIAPRPPNLWNRRRVGLTITKASDGRRLMLLVTTNSYKDRENEAVASQALKEYVDSAWSTVEGKCLPRNPLLLWHGGEAIGDIVWTDMEGPFLLEVAKERPNRRINVARQGRPPIFVMVKEVWDYAEQNPDNLEWGASHGFVYLKRDKSADGTYQQIYKFESSVLPLHWAANPYTFSGVVDMEPRDKLLTKLVGERTGKAFRKGARALDQALAARGLQHKEKVEVAEKGLLEDLEAKIGGMLGEITDDPAKAKQLQDDLMQTIVACLATGDSEPDGDEAPDGNTESEAAAGYGYDSADGAPSATMSSKELKLLDKLIETQEGLYEGIQEIAARQKALEPVSGLPDRFKAMEKRIAGLETQLKMRPQAASESDDTIVEDADLLDRVKKSMAKFDPFFGAHLEE